MYKIPCPSCKKQLEPDFGHCPYCGVIVNRQKVRSPFDPPEEKEEIKPLISAWGAAKLVIYSVIFVILVNSCDWDQKSDSSTTSADYESERTMLNVSEACSLFNTNMTSWKSSDNDGVYRCISGYIDVSPETDANIPNNVAYYVEGRENSVEELKVVLNINIPKYKTKSTNEFIKMADALYSRVNNQPLPAEIKSAIKSKKTYEHNDGKLTYNVEYEKNGSVETQKLIIRLL